MALFTDSLSMACCLCLCSQNYVQSRLAHFMEILLQRMQHHDSEFDSDFMHRVVTDTLAHLSQVLPVVQQPPLPLPLPLPLPTAPEKTYQLVFRHDCM